MTAVRGVPTMSATMPTWSIFSKRCESGKTWVKQERRWVVEAERRNIARGREVALFLGLRVMREDRPAERNKRPGRPCDQTLTRS